LKERVMKKRGILVLGLSVVFFVMLTGFPGYGQDQDAQVYVIKKGDTLWDLSNEYMNDPYQWPELWQRNQYITNPHLIYPGNALRLYGRPGYGPPEAVEETEKAGVALTEEQPISETAETGEIEEVMEETVVAKEEVRRVEEDDVAQVLRKGDVEFVILEEESLGEIVDARYEKRLLAQGDTVYLAMKETPPHVGERFLIFRTKKMLTNPYTKKRGKKIYVVGALKVTAIKGVLYQAEITDSMDAVLRGDEVMTYRTIQ
jgi:hypothetical protein